LAQLPRRQAEPGVQSDTYLHAGHYPSDGRRTAGVTGRRRPRSLASRNLATSAVWRQTGRGDHPGRNAAMTHRTHWINGKPWTGEAATRGDIYNPASGRVSGTVDYASAAEVGAAVAAAKAALPPRPEPSPRRPAALP